jgi:hypothetical protein
MSKLLKRLEQREDVYKKDSINIIREELPHLLEALHTVFAREQNPAADRVVWDVVEVLNDKILMIQGYLDIKPGELIEFEGEESVTVTEEMSEVLTRLIKISLPIALIEQGTVDDIVQFIENQTERVNSTTPDVEHHVRQVVDPLDGFDIENLTDEQLEALIVNSKHKIISGDKH